MLCQDDTNIRGGFQMENQTNFNDLTAHLRELLKSASYSDTTMKDMDFILQSFASYMEANSLREYTPEIGESMIRYCEQELHVCESRVSRAKMLVRKLNRLYRGLDGNDALWGDRTVIPELPEKLMTALESFSSCGKEKGNKEITLHYKKWICGRFLKKIADHGCEDIANLTGELVQTAFLELKYTRYWERLAPFLRFLFEYGFVQHNYSTLIINRKNQMPHPTVYSPEEISKIEKSIDRTIPAGIRNYAIVLLLSRYGIRSCDIAALSFENLDFKNNRIHFVQQKTSDPWENVLFPEVREALLDYIQKVRPKNLNCSKIFRTLVIPYKPMNDGTINTMVGDLVKKSGVFFAGKRHGSRIFRSSLASNMIYDKVSTEVVRRVLGHGTKYAIKHYVKIDIESMRICPLSVPEPRGTFAKMLSAKRGGDNV